MKKITVETNKGREVIDITDKINHTLKEVDVSKGMVNLFVLHTTAAISTADLDPGGTDLDYLDAFDEMVPNLDYRHPHNPEHMPDHILSSIVGTSINVPVKKGSLVLGRWQKVVLFEFDGPRERDILVSSF